MLFDTCFLFTFANSSINRAQYLYWLCISRRPHLVARCLHLTRTTRDALASSTHPTRLSVCCLRPFTVPRSPSGPTASSTASRAHCGVPSPCKRVRDPCAMFAQCPLFPHARTANTSTASALVASFCYCWSFCLQIACSACVFFCNHSCRDGSHGGRCEGGQKKRPI
jgi:hypothetical protein